MLVGPTVIGSNIWGNSLPSTPFDRLLREAVIVGGSALQLTNVRAGARKSIIDGTDVPANTPGLRVVNGIFVVDNMAAATIKVTNVLSDWTQAAAATTEPSPYLYRITEDAVDTQHKIYSEDDNTAANNTTSFRVRQAVGTRHIVLYLSGAQATERLGINLTTGTAFAVIGSPVYKIDKRSDGWIYVDFKPVAAVTNYMTIGLSDGIGSGGNLDSYQGDGTSAIEVENVRTVALTAPAAAFPDNSPASTAYATDVLTFLHTYTATTTFQVPIMPNGWGGAGNPADAEAVLLEAGALQLKLSAAGFIETSGGAVSTKKLTADTLSVITVECDGINHTLQVDGETPVVAASAIVPSGTSYYGNLAAGTKPSHALEHIAIWARALTAAEITTGEEGYQAKLGGMLPV